MKQLLALLMITIGFSVSAQTTLVSGQINAGRIPTPTLLFLNVAPDARSAAMGDAGVALSVDANAIHWNTAKLATTDKKMGFSMSYTPWLRNLVNDMALYNVAGYTVSKKNLVFGFSVDYFDQGMFQATLDNGTSAGNFNSKEFALGISHARKLSPALSLGMNLKYINSNLLGNYQGSGGLGNALKPAETVAADISVFYSKPTMAPWKYSYGLTLSNISGKVTYGGTEKNFIPTNLRIGMAATHEIDDLNKLTFTVDLNKLMVPTPPAYENGKMIGTDPATVSAIGGIFGSLGDAPDGISEEMKEVTTSVGAEYLFNNAFALRAGYFHESEMKGNRKYFTFGLGFKMDQKYGLDFAYLVPSGQGSPLANTLRLTLIAGINQPVN
ncbi:type IX secretion system outer membrane channel protein PorV [Aquirufa sp. HETE-83D]|uniref:Type IX secretion system outer membrane channel protein PorV n=1 Tax=Aquirufa esocilacus TaxID=3096513 RepID=A0ABW6DKV5_9BACT